MGKNKRGIRRQARKRKIDWDNQEAAEYQFGQFNWQQPQAGKWYVSPVGINQQCPLFLDFDSPLCCQQPLNEHLPPSYQLEWQQQFQTDQQAWQVQQMLQQQSYDNAQQPPRKRPRLIEDNQPGLYPKVNNEKAAMLDSMLLARALQERKEDKQGEDARDGDPASSKKTDDNEKMNLDRSFTVMVAKISTEIPDEMMVQLLQKFGCCTWRKPTDTSSVGFCTYNNPRAVALCTKSLNGLQVASSCLLVTCDKKSEELVKQYLEGQSEKSRAAHEEEQLAIKSKIQAMLDQYGFSSKNTAKKSVTIEPDTSGKTAESRKTPVKENPVENPPKTSSTSKKRTTVEKAKKTPSKICDRTVRTTRSSSKKKTPRLHVSAKKRRRISAIRFPDLTSKHKGQASDEANKENTRRTTSSKAAGDGKTKYKTPINTRVLRARPNTPMIEQAAAQLRPLSALPTRLQELDSPLKPTPAAVRVKSCSSKGATFEFSGSSRRKQQLVTTIVDKKSVKVKYHKMSDPTVKPIKAEVALTPGKEYTVTNYTVETRDTPNTRSKKVIVSKDKMDIRAAHNKSEVLALYVKLLDFMRTTKTRQMPIQHFYRNKPAEYFEYAFYEQDNFMHPHLKDFCGSAGSAINGRLKGLFFSGFLEPRTGKPRKYSPFGEERLNVISQHLLEWKNSVYFADFYCLQQVHYVTVVVAPVNSEADKFCADNLIKLRLDDNPILMRSPGNNVVMVASSQAIHVELFYTDPIDITRELHLNGYFSKTRTIGRGHSVLFGKYKNKDCKICNI